MKRTRLIILTALMVVALFAAVIPALADPFDFYNLGHEFDDNGDGRPDKWHLKGDTVWVCDHGVPFAGGPCLVVITPSGKVAALYQHRSDASGILQEGTTEYIGYAYAAAKRLGAERAYFGYIFHLSDGAKIKVYDNVPGGNYNFMPHAFYDFFPSSFEPSAEPVAFTWGVLAIPGDGYYYIDTLEPFFF